MPTKDHNTLFSEPQYVEQFERKKEFENGSSAEEIARVSAWTQTEEYRELNFARGGIVINPCKACQPLGAVLAALGFEKTLPFVQGSQGCTAYFRSYFSRHFKEPIATVSSSMTEDAAVFGGLSNMIEGLENANAMYKPDMIAVSTTCMAEVIGDDLSAYIKTAKDRGAVPADMPIPFAHTPSFSGSHLNGYDLMMKGILENLSGEKAAETDGTINIIPGFDGYSGNLREIKHMLGAMGVGYRMLGDYSDVVDAPATGEYDMYPAGGTPLSEVREAINAQATIALQRWSSVKTGEFITKSWGHDFVAGPMPIGITATDEFLSQVSASSGKPIGDELELERGRAVDAMVDSHPYVHGKRVAVVGDPDVVLGLISFMLEVGMRPVHIVVTNGEKKFKKAAEELLASSPYGSDATVWVKKDMWHLRSLMFTEPVDLLLGPSNAKFLWRDTNTTFVRVGFPLFDRHHLHKRPIIGYNGATNLLTDIVNTVLDEMDRAAFNTPSFDLVR
ncbi:MAG: nitrogenase molybdenum-iron protein subunit beta [Actinobacteria bacterium]|nr:nitrogenase molybdenum-iron protein subunit beta [Actinomycetota bacterium]MCG2806847.1 nitrogenase molybdenum-iron protein subunit beta [Coriobacteriia bacterium]